MRQGIVKDVDFSLLGAMLAQDDSDKQVRFFKAFVEECKSWGTNHQVEMQLAAVNLELTQAEIEVLKMLTYTEE